MSNEARAGVLQGTLDLMILHTLAALGPQHGYAIAARLEQVSDGALQLNMGTLYPGLTRLEARGWISARWAWPRKFGSMVKRSGLGPGGRSGLIFRRLFIAAKIISASA